MSSAVKVAVVGASGYAGEELVSLLLRHPLAKLASVTSRQYAGQTLAQVFPRFSHWPAARQLRFEEPDAGKLAASAPFVFLAVPHGVAAEYAVPLLELGARVIDLSADFRLKSAATYAEFYGQAHPAPELLERAVYGLVETHREQIRSAQLVACPGCYPTSILLPTLPLLRAKLIQPGSIIANSLSGVSGAGRKVELDYLFAECNESLRPYGVPKHRHLSEMEQELSVAAGQPVVMQFTPHLIPVTRGILSTITLEPATPAHGAAASAALAAAVSETFQKAYGGDTFVRLLSGKALPDTKNVVGTNFVEIAWRVDPRTGRLIVMSAEDNIVKGTSGQAVQCFNAINGFAETSGLI